MYSEADEDGERSLPGKDKEGKYHIVGKVEVASGKQAKMLMENCEPIWELIAEYRKAILAPMVRYFRCSCCEDSTHCVNVGKAGYRRGMLADLGEIRDAMLETCLSAGMKGFKVINPNELMCLSSSMEEDEVARLMGEDPVHPSAEGFVTLAEKLTTMLEDRRTTFQGEKRTREVREAQAEEGEEMITWGRQKNDWIFYTVSGKGREGGQRAGYPVSSRSSGGRDGGQDGGQDGGRDGVRDGGREDGGRSGGRYASRFDGGRRAYYYDN
jgi:uncharacterized membrane protein YgcG